MVPCAGIFFASLCAKTAIKIIATNSKPPQAQSMLRKNFVTPRSDRPKQYVMCGTILAPLNYLATNDNAVSFQQSPDFIGSPFYPNDQQVTYQRAAICPCDKCCYKCCTKTRTVGGGFVEAFAFGGEAPKKQDGGEGIPVGEPKAPWALPYAVGTSDLVRKPGIVLDVTVVEDAFSTNLNHKVNTC